MKSHHLKRLRTRFLLGLPLLHLLWAVESSAALHVKLEGVNAFPALHQGKLRQGAALLEEVLNSPEFPAQVESYSPGFRETQGLSPLEILARIHEEPASIETLDPLKLRVLTLQIRPYRSRNPWSSVAGYTRSHLPTLWLNVRFLARDSWSATDVAGNLAHEWMHQLGFEHAWRHEPGREHTVPYAIGTLVERLAR